ncbi:MAG TPA: bifunctional GNAT family N-acetyltransferase/acetate--CoA ligase family protein [Acidimicrobiales bacterium]|nr:bifunctional GNAT family N-acetyltransferase/acetate--CoA ligase family protein [Acidimicrobiales bacterium]
MTKVVTAPPIKTFDALLADGRVVQVRPIEPTDAARLVEFHEGLSRETKRLRFFAPHPHLSNAEVIRFTTVDHHDREALVALGDDELIGVARYDREAGSQEAEVAFVVADAWQGSGVASLLLEHLAARARTEGLTTFVADTLPENRKMQRVFSDSGLAPVRTWDLGVEHLVMRLHVSDDLVDRIAGREHISEARSVEHLMRPGSIAVIGAGGRPGTVGHEIVHRMLEAGFRGAIYPVNPKGDAVEGLTAFRSVAEVPGVIDLGIVAIAADKVAALVPDCAAKGARGLVVISGGFAEVGAEGADLQHELTAAARRHGMRIIGPNCVGIVNTDLSVRLDATFGAAKAVPGPIALASQSGAVGIAVLNAATRAGIGISSLISLGNKADVSGNDFLQYCEDDERTKVVLLYLESFGNPMKFARLTRRIGRVKPIVAVKSGRTAAGVKAASSHTAAMAANDAAVEVLLQHCGVVRVDTIDQLLDAALLLAHQPLPAGGRVAIVGNSGGPGIMGADACAGANLTLATISADCRHILESQLSASASTANPVDLLGDAAPSTYRAAITAVAQDPGVDALVVIHAPTLVANPGAIAAAIASAATNGKPVVAVIIGRDRGLLPDGEQPVPVFGSVEPAIAALGHAVTYATWRARPPDHHPSRGDIDLPAAREFVNQVLTTDPPGRWLDPEETSGLLASHRIPYLAGTRVVDIEAACAASRAVGYPVVLKVDGPDIVHKSDVGGVALGLRSAKAVAKAWNEMASAIGPKMTGALVQPMARPGVELIAGAVRDDSFGPLILFGMGGVTAELLGDRGVRVAPLSDVEASELVHSLRCAPLLTGYRGAQPVDVDAIADLLVRLSLLTRDVPEIRELDLNPVIASSDRVVAVDARVRVAPVVADRFASDTARQLSPPRPA